MNVANISGEISSCFQMRTRCISNVQKAGGDEEMVSSSESEGQVDELGLGQFAVFCSDGCTIPPLLPKIYYIPAQRVTIK